MKKQFKIALVIFSIISIGLTILYYFFDNDKIHVLKEYNSSGKLIGINEYILKDGDTIFHGKFINYNVDGIKISEGQFINDEPHGNCKYYYDNGKIEAIIYRKNSKINLEGTYYNKQGSVEKYFMCDSLGKIAFIIKFRDKRVKMYDGYSIWPVGQYKIKNKKDIEIKKGEALKLGDTIRYYYLVANIPNAKRTFKIENVRVENSKQKRIIRQELPTEIIVEEVLTQKGLNRIKLIAQYAFDDKVTPNLNKVVSFDINVD